MAGRLVATTGGGLALATAAGRLALDEVQPAGGRRMSAAELLRGRPALVGKLAGQPPSGRLVAVTAAECGACDNRRL